MFIICELLYLKNRDIIVRDFLSSYGLVENIVVFMEFVV